MKIINGSIPHHRKIHRIADPSREVQLKLKWFDFYNSHKQNAAATCRHFNVSRQTFYRWKRRYNPQKLKSLEPLPCRPIHVRQPTWSPSLARRVLEMREENPRWGKEKLADLLHDEGYWVSVSMVGRILKHMKEKGMLVEPKFTFVSTGKRQRNRPYAIRKPKDHKVQQAGDLVQLDTLDIRPLPNVVYKHFTSHDVISKWNVMDVFTSATSANAARFLDEMIERMPFKVNSIQIDGGSEFQSVFEEKCRKLGIRLFVLPPRSPKLNGGVERAHRTHSEEFYEVTDSDFSLPDLRQKLLQWELRYNTFRPHQSLKYLTPSEFIHQHNIEREEVMCH